MPLTVRVMRVLQETLKLSGRVCTAKFFKLCLEKKHCVFSDFFFFNFIHFPSERRPVFLEIISRIQDLIHLTYLWLVLIAC